MCLLIREVFTFTNNYNPIRKYKVRCRSNKPLFTRWDSSTKQGEKRGLENTRARVWSPSSSDRKSAHWICDRKQSSSQVLTEWESQKFCISTILLENKEFSGLTGSSTQTTPIQIKFQLLKTVSKDHWSRLKLPHWTFLWRISWSQQAAPASLLGKHKQTQAVRGQENKITHFINKGTRKTKFWMQQKAIVA